jgi:hypothetical protein
VPRYTFPAGTVTNTTGAPLRLTFHSTNTTSRRESDLSTIDASLNLVERIPNGVILTDSSGAYSAFAGPDDIDTLYLQIGPANSSRTAITATGTVAGSGGTYLNGTYAPKRALVTSDTPLKPGYYTSKPKATGYDPVDQIIFFNDQNGLYADTYTSYGQTISTNKDFPLSGSGQSNPAYQVRKIVRFKGNLYCLTTDQTASAMQVYRAAPAGSGNTAYSWSLVHTGTTGSKSFYNDLDCDASYIYAADYGDPLVTAVKAASIWRSSDGTTWQKVWTGGSTVRHVHAVTPDPYNPGMVYATIGDGVTAIGQMLVSSDYGATWTDSTILGSQSQGVAISFDANYIYIANDASYGTHFLLNRALTKRRHGSHGDFRTASLGYLNGLHLRGRTTSASATFNDFIDQPFSVDDIGCRIAGTNIPNGTTITGYTSADTVTLSANATATNTGTVSYRLSRVEHPYSECFQGVVDPATGVYYFVAHAHDLDTLAGITGGRPCLFYVPQTGATPVLLDAAPGDGNYFPHALFIAGGRLFYGCGSRPLLSVTTDY